MRATGVIVAPVLRLRMAALTVLLVGCEDVPRTIDPFPVDVDLSAGPVLAAATGAGDDEPRPVVVDVLSPVTVLDSFEPGEPLPAPRRRRTTLTLFGLDAAGAPTVPRARFEATASFDIHPCAQSNADSLCRVGHDDQTAEIRGVIGSDLLGRSAVRFDMPDGVMRFFPDTPGGDDDRFRNCDAVMSSPYAGGGTLIIAGSEVNYAGRRVAIGACFDEAIGSDRDQEASVEPFSAAHPIEERGLDALMVLSTGVGPTLLAASKYEQYARDFGAPPLSELPRGEVYLSSGPIPVAFGTIERLALVGEASDERGPCRELYANRLLAGDGCNAEGFAVGNCPCKDKKRFCRTGAAVVLDAPITVAVLDDNAPLLQALRDELRPALPEVDGILGVGALSPLRVVLDYPNNRLLLRCLDETSCKTRPQVRSRATLDDLAQCLEDE